MAKYRTDFRLACEVNVASANAYLQEDDMTKYLKDEGIVESDAIESIKWEVTGYEVSDHGLITLVTNRELNSKELDSISDWVSSQNSDGLGESFEQYFGETTEAEDEYEEDYTEMASFDWKTNSYKFIKF